MLHLNTIFLQPENQKHLGTGTGSYRNGTHAIYSISRTSILLHYKEQRCFGINFSTSQLIILKQNSSVTKVKHTEVTTPVRYFPTCASTYHKEQNLTFSRGKCKKYIPYTVIKMLVTVLARLQTPRQRQFHNYIKQELIL